MSRRWNLIFCCYYENEHGRREVIRWKALCVKNRKQFASEFKSLTSPPLAFSEKCGEKFFRLCSSIHPEMPMTLRTESFRAHYVSSSASRGGRAQSKPQLGLGMLTIWRYSRWLLLLHQLRLFQLRQRNHRECAPFVCFNPGISQICDNQQNKHGCSEQTDWKRNHRRWFEPERREERCKMWSSECVNKVETTMVWTPSKVHKHWLCGLINSTILTFPRELSENPPKMLQKLEVLCFSASSGKNIFNDPHCLPRYRRRLEFQKPQKRDSATRQWQYIK